MINLNTTLKIFDNNITGYLYLAADIPSEKQSDIFDQHKNKSSLIEPYNLIE